MNYVWMIERDGKPIYFEYTRKKARTFAKYYNGFAHLTKQARFKVKKYEKSG